MKEWVKPEIQHLESLNKLSENKVLTIESSLYASGCHGGLIGMEQ